MVAHILKTSAWSLAGTAVAIGLGADGFLAFIGGAVWVAIFA